MSDLKNKWNLRWLNDLPSPLVPDPWLLRAMPFLSPGPVLDIACGRGRNALYLARRGFAVTGIDISDSGLKLLEREAASRKLTLDLLQRDLEQSITLPKGPFDIMLMFFYLQRSLYPAIKDNLPPGGTVVLRSFSKAGCFTGGPQNPEFVLNPGELPDVFADWEILLYEEGLEQSRKGGNLAGIVARKPGRI